MEMLPFLLLLCLGTSTSIYLRSQHGSVTNMNGEYLISNANSDSAHVWDSNYAKFKDVEYFDVYSPVINSKYSEVFWTMMDPVPLPQDIVEKFKGKTLAVVGYETDQVMRTADGDVSVPITHAYNHHFCAYMSGSLSELRQVTGDLADDHGMNNHGSPSFYMTFKKDDVGDLDSSGGVPTSQFFSEGNGGEFRKSYHGYPEGFAQLIESPTTFHIQPMQIDTKNRHYDGPDFRPDLLPKTSAAPPNASYSGLLECPCTDRIERKIEQLFSTQTSGSCPTNINNASICFEAAASVVSSSGGTNETVEDTKLPGGCSVVHHSNGTISVIFNSAQAGTAQCGGGSQFEGTLRVEKALTSTTVHLDSASKKATITMSGPNGKWFSAGFNAPNFAMSDKPYTIVVDGTGNVSERKLGDHDPGTVLAASISVTANKVVDGVRTVTMTRDLQGKTSDHFTFDPSVTSLSIISASGLAGVFAYHGPDLRSGGSLALYGLDSPTCICDGGIKGTLDGVPFHKDCLPEPKGDLLEQRNPTCWVNTYQGGLHCCHHQNILLDKNQTPPEEILSYQMKFRFYYQPYTPPSPSAPASHNNLLRMWYQTEVNSGEYDVTQCPEGTPAEHCVHQITARFKVSDMMKDCDITSSPTCWGDTKDYDGINLIYAAGHCHAPTCLSMELYNADTGKLLCSHYPVYGKTHQIFDELGYIAIPPCLWGKESEGLLSPVYLPYDANLLSIKRNNNTYTHYGEMAMWQMRGVLVKQTSE